MESNCTDESLMINEIIERAAQGDQAACNQLVTHFRASAVRTARSFVRDRDTAEDIAQEAFVRTLMSLHNLRNPEAFRAYLTRTIINLSINHTRRRSSKEVAMECEPPPKDESLSTEDVMYIHDVLDELPQKYRAVLVLKEITGLDYAEIGKTLRLPVGTVRSRLSAARKAFRRLYFGGLAEEKEGRR